MKRAICFLFLAWVFAGCEARSGGAPGSGSGPSVELGVFTLSTAEKARVLAANGRPMSELFFAVGAIVGERGGKVKKNELVEALDQAFELRCHEICEVDER